MSAIVISRDDEAVIARRLGSVVGQVCPEWVEIIVVVSGRDGTARIVRERFPEVTLVALGRPALPGEARNAGLREARGEFVTFPGSHVELPPGSLAARLRAHRRGFAMVTGATLNGTTTPAGWASYFLDHASNLPHGEPTVLRIPPAHCSYSRAALARVGGFPEGVRAGEDTSVNAALFDLGYQALRDPRVLLVHHNPCRTPRALLWHHFARGQGEAHVALRDAARIGLRRGGFRPLRRLARFEPTARLAGIARRVATSGAPYRSALARALPLVSLGAWAAWAGIGHAMVRARHRSAQAWTVPVLGSTGGGGRRLLTRPAGGGSCRWPSRRAGAARPPAVPPGATGGP
jgi:hypothetical protein